jgi:stress-induced morphogen
MAGSKTKRTPETKRIEELLKERFPSYPKKYPPIAYRYNPYSIRVRLVDKQFKGMSLSERYRLVEPLIECLPEETQEDITILLILAPDELNRSAMNLEFETPTPSPL